MEEKRIIPGEVTPIPEYDPEMGLERFRREITHHGEDFLKKLKQQYGLQADVKGFAYRLDIFPGFDMNVAGGLETCLATIDQWTLDYPQGTQMLVIGALKEYGIREEEMGKVVIDFVKGTICYDDHNCYGAFTQTDIRGLFALGTDIAKYYAKRIRKCIKGFAELDKLLQGKESHQVEG